VRVPSNSANPMNDRGQAKSRRRWTDKFGDAFRGFRYGVQGQSSFAVHFFCAAMVFIAGCLLQVTRLEWCILVLCITVVLATEMMNSSMESLGRAIDSHHNPNVGRALEISSASVLLAATGAAVTGAIVLGYRCGALMQWW